METDEYEMKQQIIKAINTGLIDVGLIHDMSLDNESWLNRFLFFLELFVPITDITKKDPSGFLSKYWEEIQTGFEYDFEYILGEMFELQNGLNQMA